MEEQTKVHSEEQDKKPKSLIPDIGVLVSESLQLFTKTFLRYVLLWLIVIAAMFASILLIAALIGALQLPVDGANSEKFAEMFLINPVGFLIIYLLLLVITLPFQAVGAFFAVSTILLLSGTPFKQLFVPSFRLIIPYFVVSFLAGFLYMGGAVLFVIPGIIFLTLFTFVSYVVILENKRGVDALKTSYALVRPHFLDVLGRLLVIIIASFAAYYLLENLPGQDTYFILIKYIGYVVVGLFYQTYMYTLYKHVRSHTQELQQVKLKWIWIIGAAGWIVLIGLMAYIFSLLLSNQEAIQELVLPTPTPVSAFVTPTPTPIFTDFTK